MRFIISLAAIAFSITMQITAWNIRNTMAEESYQHGLVMRQIATDEKPIFTKLRVLRAECVAAGIKC